MSTWQLDSLNDLPEDKMAGAIDFACRSLFFFALDRVRQGRITIVEGEATQSFGVQDDAEIEALVRVRDARFYRLAVLKHSLGAAEAYRRGYWDTDDLTNLMRIFVRRRGHETSIEKFFAKVGTIPAAIAHALRRNTKANSRRNIEAHYDLGNDFFELFLDPSMTYSCGIFESDTNSMEQASRNKLTRICDKLMLKPGMSVVEIGSGWGSFAILAAREYGCMVTSVTLSKEQHAEATKRVRNARLEDRVEIKLLDYRDLEGQFDRLVSIEMIEAIGHARMPEYFAKCASLLKPDGLMAIQAITMPDQGYEEYLRRSDFIQHFVFPGSCCPARSAILEAVKKSSDLRAVDLEEIGPHYATTLRLWREEFMKRIPDALDLGYPRDFLRLWHYYFCYCEAGFVERYVGDVQIVFAKPEFRGELVLPKYADESVVVPEFDYGVPVGRLF